MNCFVYSGRFFATVIVYLILSVFLNMLSLPAWGEDELRVERHKDKTVYVVDSKKDEDESDDKERSWEMLRDMMIIEKRGLSGKGQDHNR
jgi:hypothetical protein